jgi:hypothetical protein
MARSVFYGVSAFVGSITGPTTCSFWPDDPARIGWTAPMFAVDLAKNPEAVRRGLIAPADVWVDDHVAYKTGGLTTIGPMFPGGSTVGLCYVEESQCAALGAYDPRSPATTGGAPYEWCTVVYYDDVGTPPPLAGRRFHGFHAEIRKSFGSTAIVSVWARGTSTTKGPMGTWTIDMAAHAHPVAAGFTQIGVAAGQPKTGALFLELLAGGGGVIPFDNPKTPRSVGGAVVRGGHRVR